MALEPAISVSTKNLLEMQILIPQPDILNNKF